VEKYAKKKERILSTALEVGALVIILILHLVLIFTGDVL